MDKEEGKSKGIPSASLIDLKAELFRKQEEYKKQKLQNQNTGFVKGKASAVTKKPGLFSKKNAGVAKRAEKDYEERVEEEDVLEKSRKILEQKAKLYEQISTGSELPDEDGSGVFLVDFQKKVLDNVEENREKERREKEEREAEEERQLQAEPIPEPETEEEEWVDYIDAFGRSRRCLRQDLPTVQQQDKTLQEKKRVRDEKIEKGLKDFEELRDKASSSTPTLLSSDMAREMEREKWEKEEREKMEEEKKGPIHYTDVRYNEVRTHGVGFYQFDKDEDARQIQMDQLHKLRQQTKDERSKSERIKEKRKAALSARLAKVKQRKREKLGLPAEEEEEKADSADDEIGPKLPEPGKTEPELLTRDDSWRKTTPSTREWDRGKHLSMEASEKAWLERQRAEREEEFAPPSFYYDSTPSADGKTKSDKKTQNKGGALNKSSDQFLKTSSGIASSSDTGAIDDMVEKQLHHIRETTDKCTSEENVTVVPSSAETGDFKIQSTSSEINVPPSNYAPPQMNFQVPPPNWNVPPLNTNLMSQSTSITPNMNVPPPNFNFPPPNMYAPPPNYSAPFPNFQVPPPNVQVPPPNIIVSSQNYYSETDQVTTSAETHQIVTDQTSTQSISTYVQNSASTNVATKKIVPKMSIIDTRLMESD